jgi:hypothetical protein
MQSHSEITALISNKYFVFVVTLVSSCENEKGYFVDR